MTKAQDTDFWFAAPHLSETMNTGVPLNRPTFLSISNATDQTANVVITLYNGGSKMTIPATITPGTLFKHDFASALEVKTIENPRGLAGTVTNFGVHIKSDVKVTAYYMGNHVASKDIYALKGKSALGTSFYVPMQYDEYYPNDYQTWGETYDQIDIVATEDGTTVTVVPNKTVFISGQGGATSPAGTPLIYNMDKGETVKIMESQIVGPAGPNRS